MKIREYNRRFKLSPENIDDFSGDLAVMLTDIGMESRNRIRIRLSLEEAMLRMQERFGSDAEVDVTCGSSLGRSFIRLELSGDPFNPLSRAEEELEGLNSGALLTAMGLAPQYTYDGHSNVLRFSLSRSGINPAIKIVVALIIGIALGILGNVLMDDTIRVTIADTVLDPVLQGWIRVLNAMAGPVIFFMVLTTVLDTRRITEHGGSSRRVIGRYFVKSLLIVAGVMLFSVPLLSMHIGADELNIETSVDILDKLLDILPRNIVLPFSTSNTPQLLLLALVIGALMNAIGGGVDGLDRIVRQINTIGLRLCEWIGLLVPFVCAALLALEIWEGRTELLYHMLQPLILSVISTCIVLSGALVSISHSMKAPIGRLFHKLRTPFVIAVKTGSLDASIGEAEDVCTRGLGIRREYTAISLPQGLILYMPVSAIGTLVFTIYAAHNYGISTSVLWYVWTIIFAVILFVATPPVPGANLLAYIMIFSQLGIPQEALIDAMIFDIVFGILASAANQTLTQIEITRQADKIGLVDRDKLRA